jgi:hypothetical protein
MLDLIPETKQKTRGSVYRVPQRHPTVIDAANPEAVHTSDHQSVNPRLAENDNSRETSHVHEMLYRVLIKLG